MSTTLDTSGGATNGDYYVTSGAGGVFSITGDYSCTPNTQVYLYALGGDSGSGTNAAGGLLAALGNCPSAGNFLTVTPTVIVNEVSTVAAAYAFAGFVTDATHVSSSGTTLAQVGIQNVFANAANLAAISSGTALSTTPAGNGIVPQSEINTVPNILASCVNTNGLISGPATPTACYTLFNDAQSAGGSGTIPSETATAAINVAHNPASNVAGLYGLSLATPPFAPALSAQPSDYSVTLQFTSPEMNNLKSLAIDASGNVWGTDSNAGTSITELSPMGVALSGTTGFTSPATYGPQGLAIDLSGNVWFASRAHSPYLANLQEFGPNGAPLSGAIGYTGGGLSTLSFTRGLAIDPSSNIWIGGNGSVLAKFSNTGTALSPSTGFTGGGLASINSGPAVDSAGNIWSVGYSSGSGPCPGVLAKFTSAGVAISTSAGYTGGGLSCPAVNGGPAIGPGDSVYVVNEDNPTMAAFSSTGAPLSGTGYVIPGVSCSFTGALCGLWQVMDGAGMVWSGNAGMNALSTGGIARFPGPGIGVFGQYAGAIDGSGNLWVGGSANINETIGIAAPVVTPVVAAVANNKLGQRP